MTLCNPMDYSPAGSSVPGYSPGKNTGVGCHALLQGIYWTQGSNSGLPHCRQIFYCLSQQGSPRILTWVASPFSRGTSRTRNQTRVSCSAGEFFTSWVTREAHLELAIFLIFFFTYHIVNIFWCDWNILNTSFFMTAYCSIIRMYQYYILSNHSSLVHCWRSL